LSLLLLLSSLGLLSSSLLFGEFLLFFFSRVLVFLCLFIDFLFLIYGKFDNYPAASEEQKREFSNQSIEMENKERNKKIRKQKSLIK